MSWMNSMKTRLSEAVPAQSLAVFRILFGALLVWDCWRFIRYDRVWRYWIAPDFHFSYPGFGWVTPLPEPWIHLAWLGVGVAALMVMLGLFYRVATVALTLLFGYFFLLDAAEYLNHFYLVILYAVLMCFLPAARVWSLDALIRPGRNRSIPRAAVFILRAQTEIMLIYAGLVKLTPDWLRGEPLGLWLKGRTEGMWIEPLFQQDWLIVLACWAVIALHVIGAPLLLTPRTRLPVFLTYCAFHAANAFFFNIGIFPWMAIAATTIFFAPDWPGRVATRLSGRQLPVPQRPAGPSPRLPRIALLGMAVWIGVQLVLPIRGAVFDSEIRWSGDGHRLSWRMRIYDRDAVGAFVVTDRESGDSWRVDPGSFLTPRQSDKMMVRPDMIHQFADHLAELWAQQGRNVSVHAEICKSLNGRPCQTFIDPAADLTQVPRNLFAADPWVLPLGTPSWGVADNRRAGF
ncbi:HTTM domain-containing protein [Paracoccus sp. Z118]|uniref:HTTM domain-containing protein n=1 Tax=Paracoccus sp. Z118 TaxID=2851017 RepID=UPI001C2C736A|nr:HTTM domain-containing protein [Paracoccus sp. Z118]MBV0890875.1 HTTM domain-containing protein [Paracoccus sp. Z118]